MGRMIKILVVLVLAIACVTLQLVYPGWRSEARAQGYFTCTSASLKLDVVVSTFIDRPNNYSETTFIRIRSVIPPGQPNAGQFIPCDQFTVTLGEDRTTAYVDVAPQDLGLCPPGQTRPNDGVCGFFDLAGNLLINNQVQLRDGQAIIRAKSLQEAPNDNMDPRRARVIATAPIAVQDRATNPISVPQWVDNVTVSRTGTTASSNQTVDWIETHFWDIINAGGGANEELAEVSSGPASFSDDAKGVAETPLGTRVINFNRRSIVMRLPRTVSILDQVAGDTGFPTCRAFNNTVNHESRHTWQNLITDRSGAGYIDNDADLIDDPDNDDDPGRFGDGDFLPERVFMNGNPSNAEWPTAILPDSSPIADPDNDTVRQAFGKVGGTKTTEPADRREFDAYEFGNATQ